MTEPVRVLQIFAKMNRGGAETMIMNLYRNIDHSKVQFDFIVHTENDCDYDEEIKTMGGRIFRIPPYKVKNHFTYKKVWREFFKAHPEYKIIHGHVRSTAAIYLKIANEFGLTTIAHSHNTSSGTGIPAITKNLLQYPIRNIADYLFACSKVAGEWLYGKNVCTKENFYILNNAIEAKKFVYNYVIRDKKRKELKIDERFVIGHIGRFHPQKNHDFLIDIFKKVKDKNEKALLLLVGDGDLGNLIKNKVIDLGLENDVIFMGVRPDIPDIFQIMDVFVFPSLYEGLGIVVVEAQASGLPCVIADSIPEEAIITELVNQISLDTHQQVWVDNIIKYDNNYKRTNTYTQIKEKEYDIEENCRWLQKYYLGLVKKQ